MRQDIENSLKRYAKHGVRTGGFLYSVLTNDLFGAMGKADLDNKKDLNEICGYIWNEMPGDCWGSKSKVEAWIEHKGEDGWVKK